MKNFNYILIIIAILSAFPSLAAGEIVLDCPIDANNISTASATVTAYLNDPDNAEQLKELRTVLVEQLLLAILEE